MAENQSRHTPRPPERAISGTTVVELQGEIDILAAPPLSVRLDTLTAGPCPICCWTCVRCPSSTAPGCVCCAGYGTGY
ncbi:hypothetical protein [Streptomyces sp. NBC_00490]|uniref:hypothetical protein n=1 Tax=Streptomyces sp. NBC_00490 TaxID=2903657 RepID=UPI003FCEBDAE